MKLGEKLSFLRKQRGMTQMELAEKLDISRQAVSRWEQGTSEPSTENLVSIGKLFDVSIDDLVNESVQLQTGSTVRVAVVEEKKTAGKYGRHGIAKIAGIVIFVMTMVLVVCMGLGKNKQEDPVPMEDITKDVVIASESVVLPLK